jgi:hypothetical protein
VKRVVVCAGCEQRSAVKRRGNLKEFFLAKNLF